MSLKWPSALVNHNNRLKTWPENKVPPGSGIFLMEADGKML